MYDQIDSRDMSNKAGLKGLYKACSAFNMIAESDQGAAKLSPCNSSNFLWLIRILIFNAAVSACECHQYRIYHPKGLAPNVWLDHAQ